LFLKSYQYKKLLVSGQWSGKMTAGRKTLLDIPIREFPASLQMKAQLLTKLWSKEISEDALRTGKVDADAYIEYYLQRCDIFLIEQKRWSLPDNNGRFLMATHQDIIDVAETLTSGQLDRKGVMKEMILHRASHPDTDGNSFEAGQCTEALGAAIDWAAGLVTMLEIGRLQSVFQCREPPTWKHHSLKEYIAGLFAPGRRDSGHVRLEESFNVQSLQKLTNLEIGWTNDLMSHLSLRNDDKKVLIFHHVTFLEAAEG
jgi:hypothetical protein